jgi:hypothetical protein
MLAFKYRGIELASQRHVKLSFMRKCLSALEHVSRAQLGATAMKGQHMGKLMILSTNPNVVKEMVTKMVAWSNNKKEPIPSKLLMYLGVMLYGAYPNAYCLTRDLRQDTKGAKLFMRGCGEIFENIPVEKGFPRVYTICLAVIATYHHQTPGSLAEEWVSSSTRMQGAGGAKLMEINNMWSIPNHARFLAQSNVDYVHSYGKCAILPFIKNSLCEWMAREWVAQLLDQVRRYSISES